MENTLGIFQNDVFLFFFPSDCLSQEDIFLDLYHENLVLLIEAKPYKAYVAGDFNSQESLYLVSSNLSDY